MLRKPIRPTDISLTPERARTIYPEMTDQEYKVYKLIYENTLQSLIKQPIRQSKQYSFNNGEYKFRQSFSKVIYDGYYVVTGFDEEFLDPNYELNQIVDVEEFNFEDRETKPAPRYNDGILIEMLDTIKVGRPSTFASTVNIIKERAFVEPNLPVLKPTEFGMIINDYLINTFPDIFNEKYTAEVESQLDKIAEHK
ncbi:DNA topoisomerase [Mycoplasmopsis felis]|uniref:DNA topoisomerase n=1 Tax=Mycoplasmopsis felis TaxID=33923 RepID=UPI003A5C8374